MGLKDKLFKVLAKAKDELTEGDKQQIAALIGGEETEPSEQAEEPEQKQADNVPPCIEAAETAEKDGDTTEIPQNEEISEKEKSDEVAANDGAETAKEELSQGEEPHEATAAVGQSDYIPPMAKDTPPADEEASNEIATPLPQEPLQEQPSALPLTDTQGEELPVDYQQIIEALSAKNMALSAENAKLRSRTEGAFGLAAKPGEFAAVNSLYDNDTTDIHFKK